MASLLLGGMCMPAAMSKICSAGKPCDPCSREALACSQGGGCAIKPSAGLLLPDRDMCGACLTATETHFKPSVVHGWYLLHPFSGKEAAAPLSAILKKQVTPEATHPQAWLALPHSSASPPRC